MMTGGMTNSVHTALYSEEREREKISCLTV
jgi:hypothetical protein